MLCLFPDITKNLKMEIKELSEVFVYFKQISTTLKEINTYVGNIPAKVAEEAIKKGYKIIGPQIWNYFGVDGNPDSKFTVDICFPVEKVSGSNNSDTKYLDGYKGACYALKGPWSNLPDAYLVLIGEMGAQGLKPSAQCREVYHLCDFENPQNCITEIQLEVK
jgi:effector-binding domain-containing protein